MKTKFAIVGKGEEGCFEIEGIPHLPSGTRITLAFAEGAGVRLMACSVIYREHVLRIPVIGKPYMETTVFLREIMPSPEDA